MRSIARASAVVIALLCALPAYPAFDEIQDTVVTLKRGRSNVTDDVLTAACARIADCSMPLTQTNCPAIKALLIADEGENRETGASVYQCLIAQRSMVIFKPNPLPTCPDRPAPDEQETRACPTGTVGAWQQDRVWTLHPYPDCWIQGDWDPAVPPEGMCPPADSDGDGVPDPADECPTVYAPTANGCPASPPAQLAAPTNVRAQGTSTSTIRVTWDAVAGASAYSLERCIGATCTGFSQLICVTGPAGTHSHLPADLTARYRVRASRDTACSTTSGNLGEYSAVVSGRTLSESVDCEVSAWGAWVAAEWSDCVDGHRSRIETRTRTVTTQSANGGAACPALSETRTVSQACGPGTPGSGTALLRWTPPTQNTDGTVLTDLAGYDVVYGLAPAELTYSIRIANPGSTSFTVEELASGTWYFAVQAYTSGGNQSSNSNVVSKVIM